MERDTRPGERRLFRRIVFVGRRMESTAPCPFGELSYKGLFLLFAAALARFCLTLSFTIRSIKSYGIG
jgi:hypothetical protein